MVPDIADLRAFYQSPLGLVAQKQLGARLCQRVPDARGQQTVLFGFGLPLLGLLPQTPVYAFMPASQGVVRYPDEGPNVSCLVLPHALPLGDASVDRFVALHALEGLSDPASFLREAWRTLKGNGRLLIVVPNRKGLWAHHDNTPFGCGQPYSTGQIKKLLKEQGFSIERLSCALYALPHGGRLNVALADKVEKIFARVLPYFGGVLIVEAGKQIRAPIGSRAKSRAKLTLTAPVPASCRAAC